ncbi:hypothetical protein CMO88_04785 [Candidatus Woesearchaeota archaeon]|nr:hypothetical protein [Candidatus Woesearchaeota archaeon]|tara:strand:+ start:1058 stop:1462 length:405 start_codon:yes stop_codon:yes gene_type:complete
MSKLPLAVVAAVIVVLAVIFFFSESKTIFKSEPTIDAEFDITIFHTKYEPNSISVKQDDLVKLNVLTAEGTSDYMHSITIDEYNINKRITSETTPETITFKADKKGTFSAYCGKCIDGPFGRDVPDKRMTLVVN